MNFENYTKEEIDEAYEKNTGLLIVDYFKDKDYEAVPAVLCKNHGPFTWGKNAKDAVHNAVVLEEVAKMAYRAEVINARIQPAPQELQDKHYFRSKYIQMYRYHNIQMFQMFYQRSVLYFRHTFCISKQPYHFLPPCTLPVIISLQIHASHNWFPLHTRYPN